MLHHYDKIGLFSPSQYSDTGHRLYTELDIARLQQIMSLKQLGFALEEIKEIMENQNFNPVELIKVQLDDVKKRIRIQELLCSRLEKIRIA
jgi:MerR family transcriptional regulator, thiopeptide resistance regulator